MDPMALLIVAFYLLPTIVAKARRSMRTGGIFVINLLLGWMILPWIIALAWAFSSDTRNA